MKLAVGKTIRSLRHRAGWNQEQAAKMLDMSVPAFSKIETGHTDVCLSRLEAIAWLFNMPVAELLSYEEQFSPAFREELADLKNRLQKREKELAALQQKMISLYEELEHNSR